MSSPPWAMSSWEADPCTSRPLPQSSRLDEIILPPWKISCASVSRLWVQSLHSMYQPVLSNDSVRSLKLSKLSVSLCLCHNLIIPATATSHSHHRVPTCLKHTGSNVYYPTRTTLLLIAAIRMPSNMNAHIQQGPSTDCLCKCKRSLIITPILRRNNQPGGLFLSVICF